MCCIISIRTVIEGIELEDDVHAEFGKIGSKTSLRYMAQLFTVYKILVDSQERNKNDVEIHSLFYDAKSWAKLLHKQVPKK